MVVTLTGNPIVAGTTEGPVLMSDEPISFWGGYDPLTGEIIDRRHPLSGRIASGHVLALPFTRGSSTSTAILLESVRTGKAPAAIVSTVIDPFLALAAVVAEELYGKRVPILVVSVLDMDTLSHATRVRILEDGSIVLL